MTQFADFLPLVIFLVTYKLTDLFVATGVLIGVAVAQAAWLRWRRRPLSNAFKFTVASSVLLGGLTLVLRDPVFIMWKPTVVCGLMGIALLVAHFGWQRNVLRSLMGDALDLPERAWRVLHVGWGAGWIGMGAINLWVAYNFDESTWVNFKVWGILGLSAVLAVATGVYLQVAGYLVEPAADSGDHVS